MDTFEIKTEGVDVNEIMEKIRERVEEKKKAGVYSGYELDNIAGLQVEEIKDEQEFLQYYLKVIQRTWDIDIGDFEIPSKGGLLGRPIVLLKKIIWFLLKFYTYRLFSQQKEFNSQIVNAVVGLNKKIDDLSAKIEEKSEDAKK